MYFILRWVDKKKGLNWISSVQSNGQELSNSNLSKLKELINKTSFSLPKDTTNIGSMQQFMDEIIEKAKKGSPIVENDTLVWVNKKDSLELLSSAKSTPQYNDIQDYLCSLKI